MGTAFVLLINFGMMMTEVGTAQEKSTDAILSKIVLSYAVCALSFFTFGYSYANKAYGGFIGTGSYFSQNMVPFESLDLIFQLSFC